VTIPRTLPYHQSDEKVVRSVKGPPPGWRARDCTWDHLVVAVIRAGPGEELVYYGIADADRALEIKRGIYRCGNHRKVSVQVSWPFNGVMTSRSDHWPPDRVGGAFQLTITMWVKARGRKHVVDTHGPDRQQWPYNPRARQQKEE
jgi:hypothetical protein